MEVTDKKEEEEDEEAETKVLSFIRATFYFPGGKHMF